MPLRPVDGMFETTGLATMMSDGVPVHLWCVVDVAALSLSPAG